MVSLKLLSNFWGALEMPLIDCEIDLILTWYANCVIAYTDVAGQGAKFSITETDIYVPVVTKSDQDNTKLLQQLKSIFKKRIYWKKYLSKPELLAQKPNLNHSVEPSFQGVNRVNSAFENNAQRIMRINCC